MSSDSEPEDTELGDGEIIDRAVRRVWPWRRSAAALKRKGWHQIDRWAARDEVVRLREDLESSKLLSEYDDFAHRELCEGRNPGDSEMPRFRPMLPLASVLPLRLPARPTPKPRN